jgi:elongation factor P--(R)-beta-lysine ligase
MRWQPRIDKETLQARAQLLAEIRCFFAERQVLEVETPILSSAAATAPHLQSLGTYYQGPQDSKERPLFLQTSPEHAMKRLLAAGSGPIYQIARVFRNGEAGPRHNPEFTLLEWYRPDFDHFTLMVEVDALLSRLLATPPGERLSYREVFLRYLGIDPFIAPRQFLEAQAKSAGFHSHAQEDLPRQVYLDFLLAQVIEPQLGQERPCFIYDYPASEAQLARIRPPTAKEPFLAPLAERFEVYFKGLELANGYYELGDAAEQRQRFEKDLSRRREIGLRETPIDEFLLQALAYGLPDCAGVALGVDRLLMLLLGKERIADVLAFPVDRI